MGRNDEYIYYARRIGTLPDGVIAAIGNLPNARVQAFDRDGNEISSFASNIEAALPMDSTGVTALETLRDGTFLVSSNQNDARFLKRFTSAGIEIAEFAANVGDSISGGDGERIAIGPTGAITLGGDFREPGVNLARFLGDSPGTTSPSGSSGGGSGSGSGSGSARVVVPAAVRRVRVAQRHRLPSATPLQQYRFHRSRWDPHRACRPRALPRVPQFCLSVEHQATSRLHRILRQRRAISRARPGSRAVWWPQARASR
jgi:hypothetical protein